MPKATGAFNELLAKGSKSKYKKILDTSKVFRTRMPIEGVQKGNISKGLYLAGTLYRLSDLHNVGKGLLTRYFHAKDTLGMNDKQAITWADKDIANTQWSYRAEALPKPYHTTTGRFLFSLGSWWMNYFKRFVPEVSRRTFTGYDVRGRKVPRTERLSGLRWMVLMGMLYGLKKGTEATTGKEVNYMGTVMPEPSSSPQLQTISGVAKWADGFMSGNDRVMHEGAKQAMNSGKLFIPLYLGAKDMHQLFTGEKDLMDTLLYTRKIRSSKKKSSRKSGNPFL